ncbi:MAG: hypothetical protein ACK4Z5_00150 [Brevundimonas sp.]
MQQLLPRTYVDVTRDQRPGLFQAIEKRCEEIGPVEWPLTMSELSDLGAAADIDAEINRQIDAVWAPLAARAARDGVTRADFVEHVAKRHPNYGRMQGVLEYEIAALTNFIAFGGRTFYWTAGLIERLAHTELNVQAELVLPPFRSCLFVFDDDVSRGALQALNGRPGDPTPGPPINVFLSYLPCDAGGFTLALLIFNADDKSSAMMVKRQLHLVDGQRVEDALRTDWAAVSADLAENPHGDDSRFYQEGLRFFRIVVNAILYLSSSAPDVSAELRAHDLLPEPQPRMNSKERKRLAYKAGKSSRLPYILVGGGVRAMVDGDVGRSDGVRRVTNHSRYLVSGHWRSQPHGPGRQQRKLVHIEPYFRGPEMADLVARPYVVQ